MHPSAPSPLYRSEAFVEDVLELLPAPEVVTDRRGRGRLLFNWLPLLVALAGIAFAVVPPLG